MLACCERHTAAGKQSWKDGQAAQEVQVQRLSAGRHMRSKVAEQVLAVHLPKLIHLHTIVLSVFAYCLMEEQKYVQNSQIV